MERVSWRHVRPPLALALGLACTILAMAVVGGLSAPAGQAAPPKTLDQPEAPRQDQPPSRKAWWDVGLVVSVKGDYAVRGGESPVSGTFSYKARWNGRLELDSDGDFVLVHLGTEVLDWHLRETGRPGGRESVLEAASATKPALKMEYLIKDGREVEFVFGLGSIAVPLHEPRLGLSLDLPRTSSRQSSDPGRGYADFVCGGSCRVAVPEEDLVKPAPGRHFSWEWRRERQQVREGRALTMTQSHATETVVTVVPH